MTVSRQIQGMLTVKLLPWWFREQRILPAVQETRVRSLGLEGPQEKGMATHSSILAWEIPWTEVTDHP